MDRDDNAQLHMDTLQREQDAIQALMKIAAAGMKEEADLLATECGLGPVWTAPVRIKRQVIERADGLPF